MVLLKDLYMRLRKKIERQCRQDPRDLNKKVRESTHKFKPNSFTIEYRDRRGLIWRYKGTRLMEMILRTSRFRTSRNNWRILKANKASVTDGIHQTKIELYIIFLIKSVKRVFGWIIPTFINSQKGINQLETEYPPTNRESS